MNSRPVLNKKDMYTRWIKGEFGNRLQGWDSLESLLQSPYTGLVNKRSIISCTEVEYNLKQSELGHSTIYNRFSEPAPDEHLLLQGELAEGPGGWWLTYSTLQAKMRVAMQSAEFSSGLHAKLLLKEYCCPSSYNDLALLLDLYPGHVIEFGIYKYNLGDVPNRNTIIWEVRKY